MGIEVIVAAVALTATVASIDQQRKAGKANKKIRNEELARNTAQQMQERRQQIREERIKRARVMQASENSGTTGSSGEVGAVSSLGTQLGSNLGYNQSMINSGNRISALSQQAADAQQNASIFSAIANNASSVATVGNSIFSGSTGTTSSVFDASAEQKNLQR